MTSVLAVDVSEIAIPFFLNYPENSTIHLHLHCTKMKFSIRDSFSKCD